MARYKPIDSSPRLLPVDLAAQLLRAFEPPRHYEITATDQTDRAAEIAGGAGTAAQSAATDDAAPYSSRR